MTPEKTLKTIIKEHLTKTGWFHFYVLQKRYSYKGISDIIAIKNGNVVFIETKTKGNDQTFDQIIFEQKVKLAGGNYILVYSLDELIEKLKMFK